MTTGISGGQVHVDASAFNVATTITMNQHYRVPTSTGFDLLGQHVAKEARHNSCEVSAVATCHVGTRVAILEELRGWATAASYPIQFKWLHGTVGVGKTTIMKSVCQCLFDQGLLMVAFFFPRGESRNKFIQRFIPTLAYELAQSIPGTRPHIEQAIEKDPLIFSQSLEAQARALVISPLLLLYRTDLLSAPFPRVIVVDGLDECSGEKQEEILETLMFIRQNIPFQLAILVASRPEPYILNRFNRHDLYNLSERIALDGSDQDIRKYYEDNFNDIRMSRRRRQSLPSEWPPASAVDMLIRRTSGQFGFAATVIGFVKLMRYNPAHQLDIILGQASTPKKTEAFSHLDQLYATILRNIEPKFRDGAIRVLGVLLVLTDEFTTLPSTLIGRLLHLDKGDDAQDPLFDVQSLVQVEPESSQLIIAHHSLREFLSDKSRANDLYVSPPAVYEDLARNSIPLLMDDVGEDLQGFLVDNMLTFFQRADPTADLQSSIEKGIENLDKIYFSSTSHRLVLCPLFYEAVKSSKLEEANILSEQILQSYTRLLSQSISLYTADDCSITGLTLLSRFRGDDEDEYLYRMVLDIFDRFPHLPNQENEPCLRDIVLSQYGVNAVPSSDPMLRAVNLSKTIISRVVNNMADRDRHYVKTARYLLGYMFTDSSTYVAALEVPIPPDHRGSSFTFGVALSQIFPSVLAASRPDTGLIQYMRSNKLSEDYQGFKAITDSIREYLERASQALSSSSAHEAPSKTEMDQETPKQPLESGVRTMGPTGTTVLGRADTQWVRPNMPAVPAPKKAKSLP